MHSRPVPRLLKNLLVEYYCGGVPIAWDGEAGWPISALILMGVVAFLGARWWLEKQRRGKGGLPPQLCELRGLVIDGVRFVHGAKSDDSGRYESVPDRKPAGAQVPAGFLSGRWRHLRAVKRMAAASR